jgi:hypothetical protein
MKRLTVLLAAGVVVLSSCTDRTILEAPADRPIAEVFQMASPPQTLSTLDAKFARLADRIPGFGGLYFDEQGVANVHMLPSDGGSLISAMMLAVQLNAGLREEGLISGIAPQALVIHRGDFDFRQLHDYHRGLVPVLAEPGVVFTDADETTNRIVIGVEEGTSMAAIEDVVRGLGVPMEAVTVVETEPIVPLQAAMSDVSMGPVSANIGAQPTLREAIRPMAGGLQIWRFIPPSTASICTLGFNAAAPSVSQERLMFTNSHCTAVRGQVTGTEYNQKPLAFPLETVAVEVADPPFFTNATNPDCPVGRRCRYSDAAAAVYVVPNQDVAFGRIMAPYAGTLVLPEPIRTFRVANEATSRPVLGQGVMKVGRTSGLTGAAVIATCQNANTAPDITMLCQERVAIDAIGGDSGSPVLESLDRRPFMDVTPNQPVRLHGLLWGGSANTYVYSSMLNIRMDFPGPWVVH